jgi:hypothetical protein
LVGERSAWKLSTPTSAGVCTLCPGSVNSGGTWQRAHPGLARKHRLATAGGGDVE